MMPQWGPSPYNTNPGAGVNQFGISGISNPAPGGFLNQPLTFWIGAVIVLVALKIAGEHEGSKINPAHYHVGGYNAVTFLSAWIVFWGLTKLAINRWFPSSGAAQFVNYL